MNDQKLLIRVNAKQHAMDWGTGIVSREQREHSFRMGDDHGYQRAINDLGTPEMMAALQLGTTPAEFLESRQKELTNTEAQIS